MQAPKAPNCSPLTDERVLGRNRQRAAAAPGMPTFLHDAASGEIRDRLGEINREFRKPAVVTGWPLIWRRFLPRAVMVADSDRLEFPGDEFDLIIHAMSLHWANDPIGQLVQCRRALQPDGLLIACLFGGETLTELRTAVTLAESGLRGGASPRILPMGDLRDLGGLLQRAGYALPVADKLTIPASYASAHDLMRELRAMGEASALSRRPDRFAPRRLFAETADIYASMFSFPDGRIRATFELVFLTGWAPSPDQRQPLAPGSATTRLADALSAVEHNF